MLQRIEHALALRSASEGRLRRFVADASHELRNPLAAVEAYAELAERAEHSHPEDLPRLLAGVRAESRRMSLLVADLLLLSRLDQGRPLEQAPVDLGLVASDALDACRLLDPHRPVALRTDGLVEVRGDRDRLRQVLDNLLDNARRHTPPGTPIEVEVGRPNGRGGTASVRVIDHGPGVRPGDERRVFERFSRAGAAPSGSRQAAPGTGLGLAIVQAIAEAHGGGATVHRTPGGGATFVVAIPTMNALTSR
jgi:two-component system OmpR family sensor kinase